MKNKVHSIRAKPFEYEIIKRSKKPLTWFFHYGVRSYFEGVVRKPLLLPITKSECSESPAAAVAMPFDFSNLPLDPIAQKAVCSSCPFRPRAAPRLTEYEPGRAAAVPCKLLDRIE